MVSVIRVRQRHSYSSYVEDYTTIALEGKYKTLDMVFLVANTQGDVDFGAIKSEYDSTVYI